MNDSTKIHAGKAFPAFPRQLFYKISDALKKAATQYRHLSNSSEKKSNHTR